MSNGLTQIVEGGPVAGGAGGEDVLLVFALPDVAAHILAERVVVIARVAHGQQVAVFGIEDEEEAVEENQNGLAHVRQRGLWRGGGDGAGQSGKDLAEDQLRKIRSDAFFVESPRAAGIVSPIFC